MPYFLPHSKTMLLLSIYNFSVTESSTGISLLGRRKLVIQVLILQSMVFTNFRRYYVGKLWNSLPGSIRRVSTSLAALKLRWKL